MSKLVKLMIGLSAGMLTAAILLTSAKPSEFDAGTDIYRQVVTLDTITDTGADTIAISPNLFSFWKYNYVVKGTQLTGTINIKATVQERNAPGSDIWYDVDTLTLNTNGGIIKLDGDVYGVGHRVLLTGSGTQSSSYTLQATLKKPY